AAGQLGRLGQAEPRRDGLHGELPGLQRVHADSNPDTGVSNFLSAPPKRTFFCKNATLAGKGVYNLRFSIMIV
ncbi:hypothetical protein, partial [Ellagibacter isourolithinifaciens]|uniref:hypothetical protein n=1 Tax=Ellagibacter isourolithinifaciens TaxID=2137581 RepID=UPI003AAE9BF3